MSRVALGAFAVTVCWTVTACAPDATRSRVEPDVATSFAQAVRLSRTLQDLPSVEVAVSSTECHNRGEPTTDQGPGPWQCDLSYAVDGRTRMVTLAVTVDNLGCYAAVDIARPTRTVTDRETGTDITDPQVGFQGCFDVHSDS